MRRARSVTAVALFAGVLWLVGAGGCGARGGPITLRFWAMGREGEVVAELMREFEAEHPGVRVQVEQIPWSAAHEKLLTAHVGRSSPDVAQLGNSWMAEFHALHALATVPASLAALGVARDSSFVGIWDTNVFDSVAYGVPWYVDTRVLFYRRDLFARAGVSTMPGDWEGFRRALHAVKALAGPGGHAIFLPINEWVPPYVLGLSAGATMLGEDGTRGAFSSPEFRRGFAFYDRMYREQLAPPVSNSEVANMYQEFERGTFAAVITGPWNLGEFARRLPPAMQDAWATAPLPGPDGPESGASTAGGSSLVVFKRSAHQEAAWQLIAFLSRPTVQARFFRLTGDLPAFRSAWADSALANDPRIDAFRVQLQRVRPAPLVPEWELIATLLQTQGEAVARGARSPDSALAQLDREVDRVLEKRRWLHARARETAK